MPVESVANGVLVTADGRPVDAVTTGTAGGRPVVAVGEVASGLRASDGLPVQPVSYYADGLVTPDGRPITPVSVVDYTTGAAAAALVNSTALATYRTARGNRLTTPLDILVITDSWGEGWNSTPYTDGFLHKLAGLMEAGFPTTGASPVERSTYVPCDLDTGGGSGGQHAYASLVAGGPSSRGTSGLGARDFRYNTIGQGSTYTVTGTGFKVAYFQNNNNPGSLGVKIDGVAQADIDCATGLTQARLSALYTMSQGTHTIEITAKTLTSGQSPIFNGLYVYNNTETKGIRVIDGAHAGYKSGDVNLTGGTTVFGQSGILTPKLVVMNLSTTNDYNSQTALATFKANVQARILDIRGYGVANCPVLLFAAPKPDDQTGQVIPHSSYVQQYADIAAVDPYTAFLDLTQVLPTAFSDRGINAFWDTDYLHPTTAGHATLAQKIYDLALAT